MKDCWSTLETPWLVLKSIENGRQVNKANSVLKLLPQTLTLQSLRKTPFMAQARA